MLPAPASEYDVLAPRVWTQTDFESDASRRWTSGGTDE